MPKKEGVRILRFLFRRLLIAALLGGGSFLLFKHLDARNPIVAWAEQAIIGAVIRQTRAQMGEMPELHAQMLEAASRELEMTPTQPVRAIARPEATPLAPAPRLQVGQTLKYRYRIEDVNLGKVVKDQTLEWEVIAAAPDQVVWEDENGTREIFSGNPFLPPASATGNSIRRAETNEILGSPESIFPLFEGKSLAVKVNPRKAGATPYDIHCQTGRAGETLTLAGAFKSVRIDCSSGDQGTTSDIFYYSPQLNHWVLRESIYSVGPTSYKLQVQLVGYTLPAPRVPASGR